MKRDSLKAYVSLRENLLKRKASLETELTQIKAALADAPGAGKAYVKAAPRKRAKNEMSLKEAVLAATKSKPQTKREILDAITKNGYTFTAKNPLNSLNTLLYSDKAFKNHGGKFGPA